MKKVFTTWMLIKNISWKRWPNGMLNWKIINQKRFRPGKSSCDYKFSEDTYYEKVYDASFTVKM